MKPTSEQFTAYQAAFDYFNRELFDSRLPPCVLNFSRKARSYGFFCPDVWAKGEVRSAEISLNPDTLHRPLKEAMSTLVHEMVHLWQYVFGVPSRKGYHNREWADKMIKVGLGPSDTGEPGGSEVGQRMSHYIEPGGPFETAAAGLPAKARLPWAAVARLPAMAGMRRRDKVKYTCPECGINAWGKEGLPLLCGACNSWLEQAC